MEEPEEAPGFWHWIDSAPAIAPISGVNQQWKIYRCLSLSHKFAFQMKIGKTEKDSALINYEKVWMKVKYSYY